MLWPRLVPQRPVRVEIFSQILQFTDAFLGQLFCVGGSSGRICLLPEHKFAGLRCHARRQVQLKRQNSSGDGFWLGTGKSFSLRLNLLECGTEF